MIRPRWFFRVTTAITVAALTATATAALSTADTTITPAAMTMTPSSAGGLVSDAKAGTVLKIWSNGGASMTVGATDSSATLKITARADICQGSPIMAVKRGGTVLAKVDVSSSAWTTYSVDIGAGTAQAPVTLEFTNDYRWWFLCDRNLYVAGAVVEGGGTPTTTVPTTTVPVTGCPVNQFQARYFNNTGASGTPAVVQCENAPGGEFSGRPIAGVNADHFSVEYTGMIDFPETTTYVVSAKLGGVGARIWVDDALAIDEWTPQWSTTNIPRTVTKGLHRISAVYYTLGGIVHFGLSVPRSAMSAPSNNGNYFAADSFWNQPVPPGATVDPRSAGWISTLDAAGNGMSVNSNEWTTTIYNAPPGTPTTQISVTASGRKVTVPYLPSFRPTTDADAHLSVIDDATGCLYEFQSFNAWAKTAIGQTTYHAYTGSGGHTAGRGHSGGELSYLGGMITPQDVQSGVIDHALRYAMPGNAPTFVYPGTRSDGTTLGGVPEGTRLQLDPTLDLTRFGLTPFQLMLARALQVYGGFNADHSSAFTVYARSTQDGTTYSQPIQRLPDSLVQHMRFLTPTISSPDLYLDRVDDMSCNQQQ